MKEVGKRKSDELQVGPIIHVIRGERVVLDRELARIYGVPTKRLNEAVKRNLNRFPEDFLIRLSKEECSSLRSQTATSKSGRGGARTLPYAFTEHGAIMAATILNSERAVQMSIFVVRAFIKVRKTIAMNAALMDQLQELERRFAGRLDVHEQAIGYVLNELRKLLEPPPLPPAKKRPIGFGKREEDPTSATGQPTADGSMER